MAITKQKVDSFPLTPETLAEFRRAQPLPGERPLKPRRLDQLLRLIKDQRFVGLDWAVGTCKEDGVLYRFDGQHTAHILQALLDEPRVEIPFPAGVLATLARYEFDSVALDAPIIFDSFNAPLSARSNEDKMSYYRAAFPDLDDLDLRFLIKVVNGITFYQKQQHQLEAAKLEKAVAKGKPAVAGQARFKFDARDAGLLFETPANREFARWVDAMKNPATGGRPLPTVKENLHRVVINRNGLVARMFADWKENPATATTFWTLVLNETAPDRDDDTRIFADQLRKMNSDKKTVNQDAYWKVAATAIKKFKRVQNAPPAPADETTEPALPVETPPAPPTAPAAQHASA